MIFPFIEAEEVRSKLSIKKTGKSLPHPIAMIRARGLAEFTPDIKLDNLLHIAAVHSTGIHAIIKAIDSSGQQHERSKEYHTTGNRI